MIDIKFPNKIPEQSKLDQEKIEKIISNSFEKLDLTGHHEIEIMFVSEKEIQDLNKKFRQIDKTTDVLSFPQDSFPTSKTNLLGSIIISLAKTEEKHEDLSDVIKHGLLHLLGYDHEDNQKKWDSAADKIDCKL